MYKLKLLLLLIIFISSWESNKDDTKKEKIIFDGILITNAFGNVLSGDNTDWKVNDSWNPKEISLFTE
jgi:hypothetical protein